jgi:cytochrome b6-f complex iron-sulfur subunit
MRRSAKVMGRKTDRRRFIAWLATLTFMYPLFRFIGFKVPKKPIYVNIHKPVPASGFANTKDFILFDKEGEYWALSRKCTHLGCKLNYHEERDILECPCHQSQFNPTTGEVIKGPAKTNLSFLPVEKRQGDPTYVVTT